MYFANAFEDICQLIRHMSSCYLPIPSVCSGTVHKMKSINEFGYHYDYCLQLVPWFCAHGLIDKECSSSVMWKAYERAPSYICKYSCVFIQSSLNSNAFLTSSSYSTITCTITDRLMVDNDFVFLTIIYIKI